MAAGFTELSVDADRQGHRTVVRIAGDLDHHSAPSLRIGLEGCVEDEAVTEVDADLSGVTFIDSGALQVFISVHATLEQRGGTLRVVESSPVVARILDLTHLAEVFGA